MFGKTASIEGVANSSIVGNHNVVNANVILESVAPKLTHSKVSELLKLIYNSKAPAQNEYSLKYPISISEKTEYNKAYHYRMHFDECADIYIKIDEVMKDFLDGEKIEKNLRSCTNVRYSLKTVVLLLETEIVSSTRYAMS